MAIHSSFVWIPVTFLLLLGGMPSSCEQFTLDHLQTKKELLSVVMVNQLAILEALKALKQRGDCATGSADETQAVGMNELETLRRDFQLMKTQLTNQCDAIKTELSQHLSSLRSDVGDLQTADGELREECNAVKTALSEEIKTLRNDFNSSIKELIVGDLGIANRTELYCPEPFFRLNTECFFIADQARKSWAEARQECQKMQADLAEPNDFRAFLQAKNERVGDTYVYLGITDAENEGRWKGVSGQEIDLSAAPWRTGQPDNSGHREHCLHTSSGNLLNDVSCTRKYNFACEYNP